MKFLTTFATALALFLAALFAAAVVVPAQWKSDLLAWRADREKGLAQPDSWLTLVGLDWLQPGANPFGSADGSRIRLTAPSAAPHLGILLLSGTQVRLIPPPGGFPAALRVDGKPAQPVLLTDDSENHPSVLTAGSLTMTVIHRGGRFALRIKDAQSPTRLHFHGLHWYPADPHYRVDAKWIPSAPGSTLHIATIIGTTLNLPAPGIAEFILDGKTLQLEPVIEEPGDTQLFFIVRDITSRTTSYGAARFLYTGFPDHGLDKPGHLILDFNRLRNPPCAYTPYATCPLPPEKNRLSIALPVGEERYSH
ncbi:DUF1684 domain-containing protein [Paracidobacterium acidisoli]|uniref:DUF1684 domain-containing protein n=1 Tax=Paracidobacterium acidisoli TaxID=2303751 RepID=A0A372IMH2_9BACT|nr:DUF1684 domain-containing protein [Paracidobacterium acidisoli]MBT9331770.1 DUF1684 domain-containing protein [Paracidobacterium acidisoli]